MLRMADRIFSQPINQMSVAESQDELVQLRRDVASGVAFVIDNCAASVFDSELECDRAMDPASLPCIKPPFSKMFLEYEIPESYRKSASLEVGASAEGLKALSRITHCGAWVESIGDDEFAFAMKNRQMGSGGDFAKYLFEEAVKRNATGMFSVRVAFVRMGQVCLIPVKVICFINRDGMMAGGTHIIATLDEGADANPMAINLVAPVYFAMSLCHCKNVTLTDATEEFKPDVKWSRRQKRPEIKYRVLEIGSAKKILRDIGGSDHVGFAKALHIVRGHFATYTEEKPLFGHIVGTVWKPSHVRGDIKAGAVVKDYAVSPE